MIFGKKKLFLFFKNNFKRNNHCKFIHHKSYLITFLSYFPCTVRREYISIIFNVKKVRTILDKIFYFSISFQEISEESVLSASAVGDHECAPLRMAESVTRNLALLCCLVAFL
jgi:hypothetical protein